MSISIDEMVKRHLETLPKPKPLPQILDEMEDSIRVAAEAARRAEGAARAAREAALAATKASAEGEKMAEEVLLRVESLEQRLKDVEESISREAVVVIREISREEAKTEIERLFKEGKVLYYSDIARQLRIDLEVVVDICEELSKEGKVRVADNP